MLRKANIVILATIASVMSGATTLAAGWGNLQARFVFDGKPPSPQPIIVNMDVAVCAKHNLVDETLVVNPKNQGVANVLVFLRTPKGNKLPIHPELKKLPQPLVLDNKGCRFEPHFAIAQVDQTIILGNKDSVPHNMNFATIVNRGFNTIIPANGSFEHSFAQPEPLPVTVRCNIHRWMNAQLAVRDNPYVAVSDADGKLEIENLPDGHWTFQFWHESVGNLSQLLVDGKPAKWKRGRVELEIEAGKTTDLGELVMQPSER